MRLTWKLTVLMLGLWAMMLGSAGGQIPAIPTVPAVPTVTTAPAIPAAPAKPNIFSFFCPPPGCLEKCKEKYCNSGIGRMIGAMARPMLMLSGGLIQPCCPTPNMPNLADLAMSPESAGGAAARIKKDEMEAKARRADVRFLGTVDCNRYPEAEAALIKALRTDRNECVRYEAALSLGKGCCCTKKTMEALLLTVTGSEKDGNPIETAPRVREAAEFALSNCLMRVAPPMPEPPEKAAPLPEPKNPLAMVQGREPVAPRLLSVGFGTATPNAVGYPLPTPTQPETTGVPTGQRGLFQIFMRRAQPVPVMSEPQEKAAPLQELKNPPGMVQGREPVAPRVPPVSFGAATSSVVFYPLPAPTPPDTNSVSTNQRGLFQIFMWRAQPVPVEKAS